MFVDPRNVIVQHIKDYHVLHPENFNTPETNPIEALFNQLKHYLKLNKKVLKFEGIKIEITNAFKKIKTINYKNYFLYAFDKEI